MAYDQRSLYTVSPPLFGWDFHTNMPLGTHSFLSFFIHSLYIYFINFRAYSKVHSLFVAVESSFLSVSDSSTGYLQDAIAEWSNRCKRQRVTTAESDNLVQVISIFEALTGISFFFFSLIKKRLLLGSVLLFFHVFFGIRTIGIGVLMETHLQMMGAGVRTPQFFQVKKILCVLVLY